MTPIQYITGGNDIPAALAAGCRWVQLAEAHPSQFPLADLLHDCHAAGAYLVLSDNAETCKEVAADGVVLSAATVTAAGSTNLLEARKILGEDTPQFIGAAVQTDVEAITAAKMGADFLQVPAAEAVNMLRALRARNLTTPVVALGVTKAEEVPSLLDAGISGIACRIEDVPPIMLPTLLTADEL